MLAAQNITWQRRWPPVQYDSLWEAAHRARVLGHTDLLPPWAVPALLLSGLLPGRQPGELEHGGLCEATRVCVPTKGFAGPEMSSCGVDRVHLSALAWLPLLSWRALHCPRSRISGLPLEHKKYSVGFPAISAAAGAATLCKVCPGYWAGESHPQSGCVTVLTWYRQGCQPDLQSHERELCAV